VVDVSGDLIVTRRLTIPGGELRWRFSGSGGPGGQHATLEYQGDADLEPRDVWSAHGPPTGAAGLRARAVIRIVVVDERSQTRNRDSLSNVYATGCGARSPSTPAGGRLRREVLHRPQAR